MIQRGRQIAYEAANAPTIPSSMPNYTHDQIRELYGELDKKTRRLQHDEYILHSPAINTWNEKPQWRLASPTPSKLTDECPLPKFRLDKTTGNNETSLMEAYLSTDLSNSQTKPVAPIDNLYTVMMNASAKVNEWANNNEIYLSPTDKDLKHESFRPIVDSSPLLLNTHLNLKQLTGTPTSNYDRPTFLEGVQQQTTNQTFTNRKSRRSIRRQQQHTTSATISSPDSIEINLGTTPSTTSSCGMYLEPYMRYGYDLPSIDHHIRDSSWQYTDNDDIEQSITSMKNVSLIFAKKTNLN
jgi:hypothetical protein